MTQRNRIIKNNENDVNKLNMNKILKKYIKNKIALLIFLLILALIIIICSKNGILRKITINSKKYEIDELRQTIQANIQEIETKEAELGNEITIESILQELLDNEIFENIDKADKKGYVQEYEVKLKFDNESKVVIEQIKTVGDVKVTYSLYPKTYTKEQKIDILFKVEGKVKSVTKPDGLIIYPKKDIVAMDYYVTANGVYKFIVEKEDGSIEEKNVIVDTIDMLPPSIIEMTPEKTKTGMKINVVAQDAQADETSGKSGIEKYEYYAKLTTEKNYTKYDTNEISYIDDGTYEVYVIAYDKVGNIATSEVKTVEVEGWIEIWNEEDLRNVKNNLNRNYIVMADIEVTNDWEPLANDSSTTFNGKLDGDGHKITGIAIENRGLDYQGLFYRIGTGGKVSNLKLECDIVANNNCIGAIAGTNNGTIENIEAKVNITVTGNCIGGIVGENRGTIKNVKVSGTISGNGHIGGIIGSNYEGILQEAYNMATIIGSGDGISGIVGTMQGGIISIVANMGTIRGYDIVGGIVGNTNSGSILNAYSLGSITVTSSGQLAGKAGGIVGNNMGATITNTYSISEIIGSGNNLQAVGNSSVSITSNSYYAAEHARISKTNLIGTATTIKWLTSKENLIDVFDFENVWDIKDGETLPYFKCFPIPDEVYIEKQGYITMDGEGTLENPYLISTEEQLKNINYYLTSCFRLMNDIEVKSEWTPISAYNSSISYTYWAFAGNLDGNGHKISNININSENLQYQGLFGWIGENGKIENLELECNIVGQREVGGIAGENYGTIENVKVVGTVTGITYNTGGIVGNNKGTISKTYSEATVNVGDSNTGGIVGDNEGTIEKSINKGNVTGKNGIGGIVGRNRNNVTDSYSLGDVTGTGFSGGIAGYNTGSIINTYSLSKISNVYSARGLVGSNTGTVTSSYWTVEKAEVEDKNNGGTAVTLEQMKLQATYEGWDFENIWEMKEYPELR